MPYNTTLQINLENLGSLNLHKNNSLSPAQQTFIQCFKDTWNQVSQLRKLDFFEFTEKNEAEISRGSFYAITKSQQEEFPQQKICLANLQTTLANEFNINDKHALSFITLCLVEPIWLPGSLPAIVHSLLLPTGYFCSNPFNTPILQAEKAENNSIKFCINLMIKTMEHDPDNDATEYNHERGSITIHFLIDEKMQVKLLPINLEFDFLNEQESSEFQSALAQDFKTWLLSQNELENLPIILDRWRAIQIDFCVFSVSIGLLIGIGAMISLIALGLTPISPLLLPPLGLALGLCLAGTLNTYAQVNIKKEREKTQRPIYLFNEKPMRTTTLFNQHRSQSAKASESKERSRSQLSIS